MTIHDPVARPAPEPKTTAEPSAGTGTFIVPDIGEEGCDCEWESIDYYAPPIFRPCAFHTDQNWAVGS